jgi:hypothetical protein
LEQQVEKLTTLLTRADEALAKPEIFRDQPVKAAELAKDRVVLAERISATEEEWPCVMGALEEA